MRLATEGARWGTVKAHSFLPGIVILSDAMPMRLYWVMDGSGRDCSLPKGLALDAVVPSPNKIGQIVWRPLYEANRSLSDEEGLPRYVEGLL